MFDYSKLRGRAKERGETQESLAAIAGMKESTYSVKINNGSDFKQSEILRICNALAIPPEQIYFYFFNESV